MIDIESYIFDKVAKALRETYPNIYVTGANTKTPPSFPCVSLIETDNSVYQKTQTQASPENHVNVTYEVEVYSNSTKGKKHECKEIAGFVDNILLNLNMTRVMLQPVPNMNDATIYRMVGRYRATVSKEHVIYRR